MKHIGRTLGLTAGMMALVGTVASAQAAGSGIPVRKGELPAPAPVAATPADSTDSLTVRTYTYTHSGGDVTNLAGWTDGNVLAHLIAGDSLEVELANLAIAKSQNAQIVETARQLLSDHGASLAKEREMATSENIAPMAHPNDHGDDHLMAAITELQNLSGADFDKAWLRHQIMHHEMHLKMVEGLEDVSKDDDLEDWVEESYTPVKTHLERLNAIAPTLGVTAGVITPKM